MRYLLATFLLLWGIPSLWAQKATVTLPMKEGRVAYSDVVEMPGVSKDDLYLRAKKWFATTYRAVNEVIQADDREKGEIVGKAHLLISYYLRNPIITHTITISVKDGKYRYVINNLFYSDVQDDKFYIEDFPKTWVGKKKLYEKVDAEMKTLARTIELGMMIEVPSDDW